MKKWATLLLMIAFNSMLLAQNEAVASHGMPNPYPEKFFHLNTRGSLKNSLLKFEKGGEATVAFLGGSITEMKGWHNMLMD